MCHRLSCFGAVWPWDLSGRSSFVNALPRLDPSLQGSLLLRDRDCLGVIQVEHSADGQLSGGGRLHFAQVGNLCVLIIGGTECKAALHEGSASFCATGLGTHPSEESHDEMKRWAQE